MARLAASAYPPGGSGATYLMPGVTAKEALTTICTNRKGSTSTRRRRVHTFHPDGVFSPFLIRLDVPRRSYENLACPYARVAPELIEVLSPNFSGSLGAAFPDAKLKALVEVARLPNQWPCACCVDLHSQQARKLGEKQQRLDCLPVWREVDFFTARERAAFAWAESVTLVSETHVPEAVFKEVSEAFFQKRTLWS